MIQRQVGSGCFTPPHEMEKIIGRDKGVRTALTRASSPSLRIMVIDRRIGITPPILKCPSTMKRSFSPLVVCRGKKDRGSSSAPSPRSWPLEGSSLARISTGITEKVFSGGERHTGRDKSGRLAPAGEGRPFRRRERVALLLDLWSMLLCSLSRGEKTPRARGRKFE